MKSIIYRELSPEFLKNWLELWESSPFASYANGPQWFLSVLETFDYKDYVLIAVYKSGKLIAVAAFVKERKYGINFYTLPPGDFVSGIQFLSDLNNKPLLRVLERQIKNLGNVFFNNVDERLIYSLHRNLPRSRFAVSVSNYYKPIVKNEKGEVIFKMKGKLMHRTKNIQDKFELKTFSGQDDEGLSLAFNIDNLSRKKERGYNTFSSELMKSFFRQLAKNFKNNFLVFVLFFQNIPIAYEIGFVSGNVFFGNQLGYNGHYAKYEPGKLLHVKFIEKLGEIGIKEIDFGAGGDNLKKALTRQHRFLYWVVISKNTILKEYVIIILKMRKNIFESVRKKYKALFYL